MRIDVIQKDIDYGVPRDACKCPVANACKRMGMEKVVVHDRKVYPYGTMGYYKNLPLAASLFIEDFDRFLGGLPFSFELED